MSRNRDALWACQVVLSAALAATVAGCALNRPHVKSLRDRDSSRIALDDVILTTVSALNALPARCGPTFDHRVRDEEFRVYQVVGSSRARSASVTGTSTSFSRSQTTAARA